MTGVNPTSGSQSSRENSRNEGPTRKKGQSEKPFVLSRKEQQKGEEEVKEKKQNQDLAANLVQSQHTMELKKMGEEISTEQMDRTAGAQICQRLYDMIAQLAVGTIGSKDIVQATLKQEQVPAPFAGAQLIIQKEPNGIVVSFSQFNVGQEKLALQMVQSNSQQLVELVDRLNQKKLPLLSLRIGNHNIQLPELKKTTLFDLSARRNVDQKVVDPYKNS